MTTRVSLAVDPSLHLIARAGGEEFAFPIADVDEALDAPVIEWVPVAPEGMLGQLKYRGTTISGWDAHWAFGLRRASGEAPVAGAAVVLRDGRRRFAIVVDDVVELTRLDLERVQPVPVGADAEGALSGVIFSARAAHTLVGVVRCESLITRTSPIGAFS
jgi:chemotaxis signal transduction protein